MMSIPRNAWLFGAIILIVLIGLGVSTLPGLYDTSDPDFAWFYLQFVGSGVAFNAVWILLLIIRKQQGKKRESRFDIDDTTTWILLAIVPNIIFFINIIFPVLLRRKEWYWQQGYEGWATYSIEFTVFLFSILCVLLTRLFASENVQKHRWREI